MTRLGTFLAGLALTSALNPYVVLAQQPAQVIGPITPGDCSIFNSTTFLKDAGFSCLGSGGLVPGLRIKYSGTTAFYVNKDTGNNSNNCLSSGSACQTFSHVISLISNSYDTQGFNTTIQYACASVPCTYANLSAITLPILGGGTIAIVGDPATPDNFVMEVTTITGCVFCIQSPNNWTLHGFKILSTVGSGNGAGIFVSGASAFLTYGDIDFGAMAGGQQVLTAIGGHTETDAPNTISGGAGVYLEATDDSVAHDTSALTISGTPAFSVAFVQGHGSGAVVGIAPSNIIGVATGLSCLADDISLIDVHPISGLPGSGTCGLNSGAVVDGINAPINVGGPETGGTGTVQINGATSGAIILNAPATGGTINGAPDINAPLTFATLPTAATAAGNVSYITDGKASNCADTTCTTFGTGVTGGGGALPLLIWYTGAAWHLVGK